MKDFDFDCLVIGGGTVGLTAVLELSRLGFSVVFIERGETSEFKQNKKVDFEISQKIKLKAPNKKNRGLSLSMILFNINLII